MCVTAQKRLEILEEGEKMVQRLESLKWRLLTQRKRRKTNVKRKAEETGMSRDSLELIGKRDNKKAAMKNMEDC